MQHSCLNLPHRYQSVRVGYRSRNPHCPVGSRPREPFAADLIDGQYEETHQDQRRDEELDSRDNTPIQPDEHIFDGEEEKDHEHEDEARTADMEVHGGRIRPRSYQLIGNQPSHAGNDLFEAKKIDAHEERPGADEQFPGAQRRIASQHVCQAGLLAQEPDPGEEERPENRREKGYQFSDEIGHELLHARTSVSACMNRSEPFPTTRRTNRYHERTWKRPWIRASDSAPAYAASRRCFGSVPTNPLENIIFDVMSAQRNPGLDSGILDPTMSVPAKAMRRVNMLVGHLEIIPVAVLLRAVDQFESLSNPYQQAGDFFYTAPFES